MKWMVTKPLELKQHFSSSATCPALWEYTEELQTFYRKQAHRRDRTRRDTASFKGNGSRPLIAIRILLYSLPLEVVSVLGRRTQILLCFYDPQDPQLPSTSVLH